jgi:hypothetical protein
MRIFEQSRSGDSFDPTISHASEIADGEDSAVAPGDTIDELAVVLSVPVRDQSVSLRRLPTAKNTFPHLAASLGLVIL